jgi:hypothetical protein
MTSKADLALATRAGMRVALTIRPIPGVKAKAAKKTELHQIRQSQTA